jgi:hypothetical protein
MLTPGSNGKAVGSMARPATSGFQAMQRLRNSSSDALTSQRASVIASLAVRPASAKYVAVEPVGRAREVKVSEIDARSPPPGHSVQCETDQAVATRGSVLKRFGARGWLVTCEQFRGRLAD